MMSEATRALEPQARQARERDEAEELLASVMYATDPLTSLLHMEAVYFRTKPDDVILRYMDGTTETLRRSLPS